MQKITLLLCTVLLSVLFTSCEPTESQKKIYNETLLYNGKWIDEASNVLEFKPEHVLIINHDTVNWTFYKKDQIVFYFQGKFSYFYDIKEMSETDLILYGFCEKDNEYKSSHYHKIEEKY